MTPLYPLTFTPIYVEKVWGGRTLETLGRSLPGTPDARIGESWDLVDLPTTTGNTPGSGGRPARSVVANGPLAGRSIHDLMLDYGPALMGKLAPDDHGDFPLMIKFIDARENLSLQCHPSPAYAAAHPESFIKHESWYIAAADPGAVIYKGIQPGVTPADLRRAIEADDRAAIESMLIRIPVKAGQCHHLPSGTCHAMGAGILVAEVQTPSDTTFRVYDWGRQGRQMHLDQAMECMTFGPADTARYEQRRHQAGVHTSVSRLVTCEFFRIEKVRMSEGYRQELPYDQPAVWVVLQGRGRIEMPKGHPVSGVDFKRGETLLIPAGMGDASVTLGQDTAWLEVTFPQAAAEPVT